MRHPRGVVVGAAVAALSSWSASSSRAGYYGRRDLEPAFSIFEEKLGGDQPPAPAAAAATGAPIVALGDGALVLDADSGLLIRADADGRPVESLAIGADAGMLVYDPVERRAYVADRGHDRITVVAVGDRLAIAGAWPTPAEPFGVALAADASTLLVTTIADRALVAFDPASGAEQWRLPLAAEPRAVAIAPDGAHAIVSHLTAGTVELVDLAGHRAAAIALGGGATSSCRARGSDCADPDAGSVARAAYAAIYAGPLAVVAFQRERPVPAHAGPVDRYGGAAFTVTRHLSFLDDGGRQVTAQISLHEPRALSWDARRDVLYAAGFGNDVITRIDRASARSPQASVVGVGELVPGADHLRACGPAGLAATDGGDVLVWCAFTRSIARIHFSALASPWAGQPEVSFGPPLADSSLTPAQHDGLVLFHHDDVRTSSNGRMPCATCHLDGRADGLSWRIDRRELQTPVLAGRVAGTAPYKWTGRDADLPASITATIQRVGGRGLPDDELRALAAYVEALPPVRTPTRDPDAIARGQALFDSARLGCRGCHDGPTYSDGASHRLRGAPLDVDTPSLIGAGAGAPYFHDGSAASLDDVLRDRGSVHGMIDAGALSARERSDLTAFLETR